MSRQQHTMRIRKAGFTLVEVMVTLAVMAILAGVTVPSLIPMYQQQKATERQANAELIYTVAQNNMAQLKANGLLSSEDSSRQTLNKTLTGTPTAASSTSSEDGGLIKLSSDDPNDAAALELLVPNIEGQLSRVGFSSVSYATDVHYCIELNQKTGYVYSVFFSEDQDSCNYDVAAGERDDEAALASMHVAYYGGGTPKTYEPSSSRQFAWVGYFEFSEDGGTTTATSGYFYQVTVDAEGNVSPLGDAHDYLHNDKAITEGAVDSSDGTAYGLLVSKNAPENFVAPSDVSSTTYEVTNDVGAEDYASDAVFYKLDDPVTAASKTATYTIEYEFYYINWLGQEQYSWTASDTDHEAAIGSTARVTNDDLDSFWDGGIRNQIAYNGYRIDLSQSTLSGKVAADGSLVLTVHLTQRRRGNTTTIPETSESDTPVLTNGTGAWYPWSTASGASDELRGVSFYVNQNFAAAINVGTSSTLNNTYQVRTDDQLQHIGTPYGSTSSSPITDYLADTFYQTHDIAINQTWYPIGQSQATNADDAYFSGKFYGGYSGDQEESTSQNGDGFEGLASPTSHDERFEISLRDGFSFSDEDAYATSSSYRSYGVFGYVEGTIAYANVEVDGTFDFQLETPRYGTLAGSLNIATIRDSTVTIPSGSSLSVTQTSMDTTNDNTMIGGVLGSVASPSETYASSYSTQVSDCTLSVQKGATLTLASEGQGDNTTATNTGGFAGRASFNSASTMEDCTFELAGSARLTAQGNTLIASNGGFIGASIGNGAIDGCSLDVTGTGQLYVGAPDSATVWSPNIYTGGFIGRTGLVRVYQQSGGINTSTTESSSTVVRNSSLSIASGASATLRANYGGGTLCTGGFSGYVVSQSSLAGDTLTADGDLAVTGNASGQQSGSVDAGGFIGLASVGSSGGVSDCALSGSGTPTVVSPSSTIAVNLGGFAGQIANATAVSGSRVELTGTSGLSISSEGASYGERAVGGFVGKATGSASVGSSRVEVAGDISISAGAGNSSFAAGFMGTMDETATLSAPHVTAGSKLTVTASDSYGTAYTGGVIAHAANDTAGTAIDGAEISVAKEATITSGAESSTYASGVAGQLELMGLTNVEATFSGKLTVTGTSSYSGSYASGLIGEVYGDSDTRASVSGVSLTASEGTTVSATSNYGATSAGGLVGNAELIALSKATATFTGELTCTSTSSSGQAYAGGLAAQTYDSSNTGSSADYSDASVTLGAGAEVSASSNAKTYSGGLVGYASNTMFEYLSLAESAQTEASEDRSISVSATSTTDWNQGTYVGGVFGDMYRSGAQNSYLASRNAKLKLTNTCTNGTANAYTGGFAGRALGNVHISNGSDDDSVYTIDRSYVTADIVSSGSTVSGFVDGTGAANRRYPRFTNDFVLGTITGSTSEDNAYAFIRTIGYAAGVKGNYAAVTDGDGNTPYKFADASSSDSNLNDGTNGTERCFVYRADVQTTALGKDEAGDGAHPCSYAYLTREPDSSKNEEVPWRSGAVSSSVLEFLGEGYSVKNTSGTVVFASRYAFAAGSKAAGDAGRLYGLSGTNPFPTATKDADGNYVNYGKWFAGPTTTSGGSG